MKKSKMENNDFERLPSSKMEVNNLDISSLEVLHFEDLERQIITLLSDCVVNDNAFVPQNTSFKNFFLEEKMGYFLKISEIIRETRDNFMHLYANINRNIEDMVQKLMHHIQTREQELKTVLNSIKSEKLKKWDHQLSVCKTALKALQKPLDQSSTSTGFFGFDLAWGYKMTKELEFIDSGEIFFKIDNYSKIIKNLKKLGNISCNESNWKEFGLVKIKPKFIIGNNAENRQEFNRPWGVCADATGRIIVCDRSNHQIKIFNECGQFLIKFGKEGSGPGEFNKPSGVDMDEKCRIIVADKDNHRIQIFTYSGQYLLQFGGHGSKPGEFIYPWDVSVNSNCDIAVSDSKNHRVQLFNERGCFITLLDAAKLGITDPRSAHKFFDSPRGIAFRPDGCLFVTDFNNHRIILINDTFTKISTFGKEGSGIKEFFRPQGIACNSNGAFAVSDSKNYRVQVFDEFGNVIKSFGMKGCQPGQFDCPLGICFHPNGNIIVVEFHNNRVQIF